MFADADDYMMEERSGERSEERWHLLIPKQQLLLLFGDNKDWSLRCALRNGPKRQLCEPVLQQPRS
jgi:hypothetical protein